MTTIPLIESPIEERLFLAVRAYLKPTVSITPQVEIETQRGIRRVDFMLTDGEMFVALEADGADYHDFDRDLDRDAMLLLAGFHAIFHFSGSFIYHNQPTLAPIIAAIVPALFVGDPAVENTLPTQGAFVRLSPAFPGLRDDFRAMVLDHASLKILSTCRQICHMKNDPNVLSIVANHIHNLAKE